MRTNPVSYNNKRIQVEHTYGRPSDYTKSGLKVLCKLLFSSGGVPFFIYLQMIDLDLPCFFFLLSFFPCIEFVPLDVLMCISVYPERL